MPDVSERCVYLRMPAKFINFFADLFIVKLQLLSIINSFIVHFRMSNVRPIRSESEVSFACHNRTVSLKLYAVTGQEAHSKLKT
jgi:hypothetical protein